MLTRHGSGLEYWLTATGLAQLVWFGRRIRALFQPFPFGGHRQPATNPLVPPLVQWRDVKLEVSLMVHSHLMLSQCSMKI
jgi:hypothetical protein